MALRWTKPPKSSDAEMVLRGAIYCRYGHIEVHRLSIGGYYWSCPCVGVIDAVNTMVYPVETVERAQRWCEAYVRECLGQPSNAEHVAALAAEIREGARVHALDDMGGITATTTRSDPWQLGDGTWVVSLVGRTGGYSLERCALAAPDRSGM